MFYIYLKITDLNCSYVSANKEYGNHMVEKTKNTATEVENSGYQVIKDRLNKQATNLLESINQLNEKRQEAFGGIKREVASRVQIETDVNCILRDAIQIQGMLLLGHNVQSTLSKDVRIGDVFSLYDVSDDEGTHHIVKKELSGTFLDHPAFIKDFNELYSYYSEALLAQICEQDGKLLIVYQIGSKVEDIKVFRWSIDRNGNLNYEDSRGEKDYTLARQHDVAFTEISADKKKRSTGLITLDERNFIRLEHGKLELVIDDGSKHGTVMLSENVDEKKQSLEDCDVHVATIQDILIAKVIPYREKTARYFIINKILHTAHRVDAIGVACRSLPEGHGIIFPGGVYLSTDELKVFESDVSGWRYQESLRSPNGEDLMYVFYEPAKGEFILSGYNMVNRGVDTPIHGHGYALFDNGSMFVFRSDDDAIPSTIHPMQIWTTSFYDDRNQLNTVDSDNPLASLGNNEIVRALSDMSALRTSIQQKNTTRALYVTIIQSAQKVLDTFYWITDEDLTDAAKFLREIAKTADTAVGEFDKVEKLRRDAVELVGTAQKKGKNILANARTERWEKIDSSMPLIHELREFRGHILSIRDQNFVDTAAIDTLNEEFKEMEQECGQKLLTALSKEEAFDSYRERIAATSEGIDDAAIDLLEEKNEEVNGIAKDLSTITEVMNEINVNDPTIITKILEIVSSIYADLNQIRARIERILGSKREKALQASFTTQMTLLSQSVTHAINMSKTVDECNEQSSRLMSQIEDMDSKFSQVDKFAEAILEKRTELANLFDNKKQSIANAIQKEIQTAHTSATKILESINSKAKRIKTLDILNGFFVSDPMVTRTKTVIEKLEKLGGVTQAEDINAKLKGMRDELTSSLKDKNDLLEDDGNIIKLGQHRFTVNHEPLDLSIVNSGTDQLAFHLNGTNYYENIEDPRFNDLREFWNQDVVSETPLVYRGEYLAYQLISSAVEMAGGLTKLETAVSEDKILEMVRKTATERYQDGYDNGVHDNDAVAIIKTWVSLNEGSKTLKYKALYRFHAYCVIKAIDSEDRLKLIESARMNYSLLSTLNIKEPLSTFKKKINDIVAQYNIPENMIGMIVDAVVEAMLHQDNPGSYFMSVKGHEIFTKVKETLRDIDSETDRYQAFKISVSGIDEWADRLSVAQAIVHGCISANELAATQYQIEEAAAALIIDANFKDEDESRDSINYMDHSTESVITDLIGVHPLIDNGSLQFDLSDFNERLSHHTEFVVEGFKEFNNVRKSIATEMKDSLRVEEYKPKPLTSFVRNRLVNDVYLPVIGSNLAKQMGTAGADRRSDLMGMLLLISPPGYGKTTLVEYVASRMGMVFMKINCPSLGHDVTSLDPADANNAAAAQEIEKINLAFEMGNNVLLYLDDIQHTHPEFLQKFISLCDGTRRVEGIWKGKSRTYDMRGRKFAIMMAGNPYTESGETFKVPDMLANRADIYNMGDMMGGQEEAFKSSYIENSLTSNKVLAPLASRGMKDIYTIMDMAAESGGSASDLEYQYSGAELDEMQRVLKGLYKIRDVALKANLQYIESASMLDRYRTEPPFKLQGSYRNMNKMAEKVLPIMNDDEILQLIIDHYRGESQTLTTGSEENLLKLKELMGIQTKEDKDRWETIKSEYVRFVSMGGDEADSLTKIANQISYVNQGLNKVVESLNKPDDSEQNKELLKVIEVVEQLKAFSISSQERSEKALQAFSEKEITLAAPALKEPQISSQDADNSIIIETLMGIINTSLIPLLNSFEHKMRMDQNMWESSLESIGILRDLKSQLKQMSEGA